MELLLEKITKHINKQGVDLILSDVRHLDNVGKKTVTDFINTNHSDQINRIIKIE